jgi:hypothetical protein
MAKKAPNTFFQNFRRREAPTIQARQMDTAFVLPNGSFEPGDYIVQGTGGQLEGQKQADFEAQYVLQKLNQKVLQKLNQKVLQKHSKKLRLNLFTPILAIPR